MMLIESIGDRVPDRDHLREAGPDRLHHAQPRARGQLLQRADVRRDGGDLDRLPRRRRQLGRDRHRRPARSSSARASTSRSRGPGRWVTSGCPIARLMEQIHKPIICAVNGICCGGGLHFLSDTDIIIGSTNAQFFDSHVNVGLISGWEPIGLSRRIPLNYVLRMTLQGKEYRIDAAGGAPDRVAHRGGPARPAAGQGGGDRPRRPAQRAAGRPLVQARDHGGPQPRPARRARSCPRTCSRRSGTPRTSTEGAKAFEEHRAPEWKGK